jgi:hypothetical protein
MVRWGFVPLALSIVLIAAGAQPAARADDAGGERHRVRDRAVADPADHGRGPVAYFVSLWLNVRIFSALRGSGDGGGWWMLARGRSPPR